MPNLCKQLIAATFLLVIAGVPARAADPPETESNRYRIDLACRRDTVHVWVFDQNGAYVHDFEQTLPATATVIDRESGPWIKAEGSAPHIATSASKGCVRTTMVKAGLNKAATHAAEMRCPDGVPMHLTISAEPAASFTVRRSIETNGTVCHFLPLSSYQVRYVAFDESIVIDGKSGDRVGKWKLRASELRPGIPHRSEDVGADGQQGQGSSVNSTFAPGRLRRITIEVEEAK